MFGPPPPQAGSWLARGGGAGARVRAHSPIWGRRPRGARGRAGKGGWAQADFLLPHPVFVRWIVWLQTGGDEAWGPNPQIVMSQGAVGQMTQPRGEPVGPRTWSRRAHPIPGAVPQAQSRG